MLAPQLGNGVHVLLAQPDHVGTQVLVLGAFLLLDRAPRRWYTVAAVWALLTAATVADKITIVDAVVPLAFCALLHAIWTRRPLAHRFELSLAVAAAAGAGAALLALTLLSRAGAFTLLPVQTGLSGPAGVPGHLALAWHGVLNLFGADVTLAPSGLQTVLTWLHAPGIALAVGAFAVVAWHLPHAGDLVSDVLAVAIVVNLAGFVASVIPATPFDTREIAALLPFGAVLAGRVFGPLLTGSARAVPRPRAAEPRAAEPAPARPRRTGARIRPAVAALALAGLGQLGALGYAASLPGPDPEQALAGWLAAHHLTCGLGTFSESNITTVDSGGAVRLLAVSWQPPVRAIAPLPDRTSARRRSAAAARTGRRRRGPAVPVVGGLVQPAHQLRELRGHRHRQRHRRPHPGQGDPRPGRDASPDLPVPVLHHHGVEHEPADPARSGAVAPARRHRPRLSSPAGRRPPPDPPVSGC